MLSKVVTVASFDADGIRRVAADEDSLLQAYIVLLVLAVINAALAVFFPEYAGSAELISDVQRLFGITDFLLGFLVLANFVLLVGVLWVLAFFFDRAASWFGGSASATRLFRALSFAAPVGLLSFVPFVGWLANAWVFVLYAGVIRFVEDVTWWSAVGALLFGFVAFGLSLVAFAMGLGFVAGVVFAA